MSRKQQYMMKVVLRELAMASNSYMDSEDNEFSEISDGGMSDNSLENSLESVCLQNYPPFQRGHFLLP